MDVRPFNRGPSVSAGHHMRPVSYLAGISEGAVREARHQDPAYLVDAAHFAIVHEHIAATMERVAIGLVDPLS